MEYYAVIVLSEFLLHLFVHFDLGHSPKVRLNEKSKSNAYIMILRVKTGNNNTVNIRIFLRMKRGVGKEME